MTHQTGIPSLIGLGQIAPINLSQPVIRPPTITAPFQNPIQQPQTVAPAYAGLRLSNAAPIQIPISIVPPTTQLVPQGTGPITPQLPPLQATIPVSSNFNPILLTRNAFGSGSFNRLPQNPIQLGQPPAARGMGLITTNTNPVRYNKRDRDQALVEMYAREAELPALTIRSSFINLFSYTEMQNISVTDVRVPKFSGECSVNCPRMGSASTIQPCEYCCQIDCTGHYGLIDFGCKIYNPMAIRSVVYVLSCTCNTCYKVLVSAADIKRLGIGNLPTEKRMKAVEKFCVDMGLCLREQEQLPGMGVITPCGSNPEFLTKDLAEKGEITFRVRRREGSGADETVHNMSINQVYRILDRITPEGAEILGFSRGSHPRNLIMQGMLVIPIVARPPVKEAGVIHHDQLTHAYQRIVQAVETIKSSKARAVPGSEDAINGATKEVSELYKKVAYIISGGEGRKMGIRDFLSIIQRLQGKTALLRGLLMGKRNNYSGRTVAGPDPSLRFGQIRLPRVWAKVLTKCVQVTEFNRAELQGLLKLGRITHITPRQNAGLRRAYDTKYNFELKLGYKVNRWLQDGDRVVINRQPTLHKGSMMSFEVVLGEEYSMGFYIGISSPYNLDFDGDEANCWVPQDFEVEAEDELIMNVKKNVMSGEQNRPIMGLVMNSITSAYLLTHEDTRLDSDLMEELLEMMSNKDGFGTLSSRLERYGVHPLSGRAAFSALLPENFYYSKGNNEDGWVNIREGILISGRIRKTHVGPTQRSIIQELWKNYGSERTADFMTDAPWVLNKWIIERGFSVGLADMYNFEVKDGVEYNANKLLLDKDLAKINVQLLALGPETDDPMEARYRESQIVSLVNNAKGLGGLIAQEVFPKGAGAGAAMPGAVVVFRENSIGVMTDYGGGAKGARFNTGQISGSVGQQFLHGERLPQNISGGRRHLPIWDLDDPRPEARGFIPHSYLDGLTMNELFDLQAGGRENLLDTALKTAETGTMQRRLMKTLENLFAASDGSIRNTVGVMFATMFNLGFNVAETMNVSDKMHGEFTAFTDIKATVAKLNANRGWVTPLTFDQINANKIKLAGESISESLPLADLVTIPPATTAKVLRDRTSVTAERRITYFERARLIGTRAVQLSENARPVVEIGTETNPVKIALLEYNAGVLPLHIIRPYPNGTRKSVYPTLDMI